MSTLSLEQAQALAAERIAQLHVNRTAYTSMISEVDSELAALETFARVADRLTADTGPRPVNPQLLAESRGAVDGRAPQRRTLAPETQEAMTDRSADDEQDRQDDSSPTEQGAGDQVAATDGLMHSSQNLEPASTGTADAAVAGNAGANGALSRKKRTLLAMAKDYSRPWSVPELTPQLYPTTERSKQSSLRSLLNHMAHEGLVTKIGPLYRITEQGQGAAADPDFA